MSIREVCQFSVLRTSDDWGRQIEVHRNGAVDINGAVITITEETDGIQHVARVILDAEQIHELFKQFFR